ncbi:hypothetical protein Tco_0145024 [Tanacetum coccineum]
MASLDYHLNPLFSIKECMSCGALYTADFCCSKGGLKDKILVPKPSQNCATYGDSVDGINCRSCAFVRKCLNEGWYTIHAENEILNTSDDNTNVVSAPREPFVFNQDPGVNSSQSPLQSAHIGYNCPPKAPIISKSEQCNQTINELPQILRSVHPTCNSEDENSFAYDSKPNSINDSPNVFNPLPQPSLNSCEFCGNDARYDHYCTSQKKEEENTKEGRRVKRNEKELCGLKIGYLEDLIEFLLDEFTGEITILHSILLGIDDVNLDPEGDILFLKSLLYDNFLPPFGEFNSENLRVLSSQSPIPGQGRGSDIVSVSVKRPGHLPRGGCVRDGRVATWDALAFKLIILMWNVKHSNSKIVDHGV